MRGLSLCVAAIAAWWLTACGAPTEMCTPGATVSCACPGGVIGVQTCDGDGRGFGACGSCGPALIGSWTAPNAGTTTSNVTTFSTPNLYAVTVIGVATAAPFTGCTTINNIGGTWTAMANTLTVVDTSATVTRSGCDDANQDGTTNDAAIVGNTAEYAWSVTGDVLTLTLTSANGHAITMPMPTMYARHP